MRSCYALVAQLDRVTGYEPVGRGFESLRAHQQKDTLSVSFCLDFFYHGPVAQLGERCVRIAEVEGSNPFGSTKQKDQYADWSFCLVDRCGGVIRSLRSLYANRGALRAPSPR